MNRRKHIQRIVVIGWTLWLSGCDRTPTPPPQPKATAAAAPDTQPDRPTTQELLSGPGKTVILSGLPLSMIVPQSWSTSLLGALTILEGPTPSDHATLNFKQREAIPNDRITPFIDLLKQDAAKSASEEVHLVSLRTAGSMKVLERRWSDPPTRMPKVDGHGDPVMDEHGGIAMDTFNRLNWRITVLIDEGKSVNMFELDWIGLTVEQFTADRELLQKVVASLQFISGDSAPTSMPTGMPAPM